jgi:putative transposase
MVAKTKDKWVRRNLGERRALLSRFEGSGLAVTAFCRRERISAASFYRWRNESGGALERGDVSGGERPSAFVDLGALRMQASRTPRLEVKLDLGDGLVLHLVRR